jgi:hypothetical protein
MKYMIISERKDPMEKYDAKVSEIDKARIESREKGERLSMNKVTPIFASIESPRKLYYVVDCEAKQLMELVRDFRTVMNIKIIPVESLEEWQKNLST